jgi:hypothetical protein
MNAQMLENRLHGLAPLRTSFRIVTSHPTLDNMQLDLALRNPA